MIRHIQRTTRRVSKCAAMAIGSLACSRERTAGPPSAVAGGAPPQTAPVASTQSAIGLVQWMFGPSAAERARLDSILLEIHDHYDSAATAMNGELHRFSVDTTSGRYLLVLAIPSGNSGTTSTARLRFFVIQTEPPSSSAPSPIAITDSLDHFAVSKVEDLDGDGLMDLAYCVWTGARGTPGSARGIGYRDATWYTIASPSRSFPKCEPQAEP
jgi:hypothetical protein